MNLGGATAAINVPAVLSDNRVFDLSSLYLTALYAPFTLQITGYNQVSP